MQKQANSEIVLTLLHVIDLNRKDAQELSDAFRKSGDKEGLERALQDLEKWEAKGKEWTARAARQ